MEELFSKSLPVAFKHSDREEKQGVVGVSILLHVTTSPIIKKELIVRLTDQNDPFFLYNLTLSEDDFQRLKVQQGLLVDFAAFPQKFIDLLQLCLSEAEKEHPKFLLHFHPSSSSSAASHIEVVETNPFRHLTHLSLKVVPATDSCLKKYLAECLINMKDENGRLQEVLASTQADLTAQLTHCQEALTVRSQELDRIKSEWTAHTTALSSEHKVQLTAEREKALQVQSEVQTQHNMEKRDLQQSHSAKMLDLESRVQELEASQKELTDHKYRSEAAIRELKAKLKTAEEESSRSIEEVQRLRKENSSLDGGLHEREKTMAQLNTRIAVLEQELKDKEQVATQTADLLRSSQEQHRVCEVSLEQCQRRASKLDTAFKSASQEVLKGNDIIQKLQTETRSVKSKLKLRNVVTTQQEKLLGEKEVEIEKQGQELQRMKESIMQKDEEVQRLEESLQSVKGQLEESRELLKTNENVISWLNKQINDQMVLGGGGGGGRVPLPLSHASLSAIRHSSPLTHPHLLTSTSSHPHYLPQFSSTPSGPPMGDSGGGGGGGGGGEEGGGNRQVLSSLASQENSKQQVVFRGVPVLKSGPPAAPSPLSSHSLSAPGSKTTTPVNTGDVGHLKKSSTSPKSRSHSDMKEPRLDAKYLPLNPTQHPVSTSQHPVSTAHHPISTAQHPVSTAHHPVSTAHHPVSTAPHPILTAHHPVSAAPHPVSTGYPTSITPGVIRPPFPVGNRGRPTTTARGVAWGMSAGEQVPLLSAYFPNH